MVGRTHRLHVVWEVRVTAKNDRALEWLKANEFELRKWFREHHSIGAKNRNEGQHRHSLYVGPEASSGGLFLDVSETETPVFLASSAAQTRRHGEKTISDISKAIRQLGGFPDDFDMVCNEHTGERIMG